jgi:hypothetical protein
MALGANPHLTLRPFGKLPQFLNLGMASRRFIGQGKALGIEDPDFAAHALEKTTRLVGEKSAVGNLAERSVEDQDTRLVARELRAERF